VELQSVEVLAEETAAQQKCHFLAALMAWLVVVAQADILATETLGQGVLVGKVDMAVDLPVLPPLERQMVAV